jgi:hypothetical protein
MSSAPKRPSAEEGVEMERGPDVIVSALDGDSSELPQAAQ